MNTDLRKKTKTDFQKDFLKLMNNVVFGRNIDILNLSQQKEEETIWFQNQIIILQSFSQKIY